MLVAYGPPTFATLVLNMHAPHRVHGAWGVPSTLPQAGSRAYPVPVRCPSDRGLK